MPITGFKGLGFRVGGFESVGLQSSRPRGLGLELRV